jgi:hypothetical protein
MRLGPMEINFARAGKKAGGPATTQDRSSSKVDQYYGVTSKSFSTYKTVVGDTSITYDILEGLYRRTIMKKVIGKLAGDATRLGFTPHCVSIDGTPNEQAQVIAEEVKRLVTRRVLRAMYRDMQLYGDAFIYKNKGTPANGTIGIDDIWCINPRYIEPDVKNMKLVGWTYSSQEGQQIPLSFDQLIHIPNEPITGQLFGNSMMEPVLQPLNLILNSQLNSAVILDRFALPLIHWQLDSKHERRKTPLPEIIKFIQNMGKMTSGSDFVSDSSVATDIIGAKDKMIDFSPMLDKIDNYFFSTAGIPGSILGMPADNLSAITRQLQTYYDNIFDMQENAADYLITDLFWPEMVSQNIQNLGQIYFSYAKPMIEQESRIATWVDTMTKDGIISKKQGLAALGFSGEPPAEPEVNPNPAPGPTNFGTVQTGATTAPKTGPNIDKKQNQKTPPGVKTK